jgi:hypothetical protein
VGERKRALCLVLAACVSKHRSISQGCGVRVGSATASESEVKGLEESEGKNKERCFFKWGVRPRTSAALKGRGALPFADKSLQPEPLQPLHLAIYCMCVD